MVWMPHHSLLQVAGCVQQASCMCASLPVRVCDVITTATTFTVNSLGPAWQSVGLDCYPVSSAANSFVSQTNPMRTSVACGQRDGRVGCARLRPAGGQPEPSSAQNKLLPWPQNDACCCCLQLARRESRWRPALIDVATSAVWSPST